MAVPTSSRAAAEAWEIDGGHTSVTFKVRHFFAPVIGRFTQSSGTLMYDAANPTASTIEFVIPAASINTDNDKRDEHLRGDDFFNTAQYPNITFKSTKLEKGEGEGKFKVTGNLTIRDVTKPVTLMVESLGFGPNAWGGETGGFSVTGEINRQDFGVKWNKALDNGGTVLGDNVKIDIGVEVAKKKA
ncbi:MAG: YceI family protein [Candidatus Eisenbacteria bacterium]|nr:YceI family protein [Candidatus Eisenbacteria bacterium]MCC7143325.1 YceI family protein [Candidatus Eisenbacteria bacterium]